MRLILPVLFLLFLNPIFGQFKPIEKAPGTKKELAPIKHIDKFLENAKKENSRSISLNSLHFNNKNILKPFRVMSVDENGYPNYLEGRSKMIEGSLTRQAMSYLEEVSSLFEIKNPENEFHVYKEYIDDIGMSHVSVHQYFNGVRIYNAEIKLHGKNNQLEILMGRAFPTPLLDQVVPYISEFQAIEIVKRNGDFMEIPEDQLDLLAMKQYESELVIYHIGNNSEKEVLAYHISAYENLADKSSYFIDAMSGQLIEEYTELCKFHNHALPPPDGPATATAKDLNNVTRTINTYEVGGDFFLMDGTRSMFKPSQTVLPNEPVGMIWTLNANNRSPQNSDFEMFHLATTNNVWSDPVAVSAHYNSGVAYEYFKNVHNRESINGSGGNIVSIINVTDEDELEMDNAFWNGVAMWYGNGKDAFFPLAGGMDVGGHEMTHGVVQSTANLEYRGESGALNESFADVFAAMMDRDDWLIGEDVVKPGVFPGGALRSLQDPHNGATQLGEPGYQPKHTNEQFMGSADNGGVHINSGIPNHAFFKLATAIGKDKAEDIFYRALTVYLTRSSQFVDLRNSVIQSASDLFGASEVDACKNAFNEVGIGEGSGGDYQEDVEENPGSDFLIYSDPGLTQLTVVDNQLNGVFDPLTSIDPRSKPSITDDGSIIVYVNANKELQAVFINWDDNTVSEQVIQDQPIWSNVVISKNGNRIAAVEDEDNDRIQVFDFTLQEWFADDFGESGFELYNPTYTEGVATGDVRYADAMEFDITGEILMYDAYSEITGSSGQSIGYWDIGFLNVFDNGIANWGDGYISKLFSQLPEEVSIGNPTFSKNSPYIIAFDYLEGQEFAILGANTETGEVGLIYENTDLSYPSYTSDDRQMIFTQRTSNFVDIGALSLAENKITAIANSEIFLIQDAQLGVSFSNGFRVLSDVDEIVKDKGIYIFPNPAKDQLSLKWKEGFGEKVNVQLYQLDGKLMLNRTYNQGEVNSVIKIDISSFSPGSYVVKVQSDANTHSEMFTKY